MNSTELIPNGVPLASVPGLTAAQIKILSDSWLLTGQELVALYETNDALRARLAAALGLPPPNLAAIVTAARALVPRVRDLRSIEMETEAAQAQYGLGALLDEPSDVLAARLVLPPYEPPRRAILPASHSLLDQLPPVRNQGSRGTCVAHAVLSVREQLEIAAGSPRELNLSEQYVYWWCKEHDGIPKVSGTYIKTGMQCLAQAGAPLEEAWPYVGFEQGEQGQGPPPPTAAHGEPALRTLKTQELNRTDTDGIKACLYENRVVAFSVPVFDSWYASSATSRWGKITLPLPGEPQNGGHAMALVGYQDDPGAPGGGYFLVRNSWQPWSWDGAWQEGYGYIPYAYIARHASAVFSATRLADCAAYLRDAVADTGARPLAAPTWQSPDIWLRQAPDGEKEHQVPMPGRPNALYVRAFNRGPAYAYDAQVEVYFAPAAPCINPLDWRPVGREYLPWLKPGETVFGPLDWTPPASGPYAFLARLSTVDHAPGKVFDPVTQPGVAQRNQWNVSVAPGGTVEVGFSLTGAAGKAGAVSLHVANSDLPGDVAVGPIRIGPAETPASGRGPVDDVVLGALTGGVMLLAGQTRRADLAITFPPDAAPGTQHRIEIVQNQGSELVGRLAVQIALV